MRNSQKGFSLIEVMIAFVLIGVGVLGLIKLQAYVEQRADFAIRSVEALNLAEKKLEWFRTRGATAVAVSTTVANYESDIVSGVDSSDSVYTLRWTVTTPSLEGSIKAIRIESSWFDRQGNKQAVRLETMISKFSEFDP